MNSDKLNFIVGFMQLMASVFLLFFVTTFMGKASHDLLVYMNNNDAHKTAKEWVIFLIGAPIFTAA